MDLLAIFVVLLAVPGLLSRSLGPWTARAAAALALCALWVATTDPQAPHEEQVPPRIALVTTRAPLSESVELELRARADPTTSWSRHTGGKTVERLQAAALAAGPGAGELVLAWTGPLDGEPSTRPLARPFAALTHLQPLPIDPEALSARAETAFAVGRPGLLSVAAAGLTEVAPARVRIVDPQGDEVLDEEIVLRPVGASTLAFSPHVEGDHRIDLELQLGGARILRRGALPVIPAPRVLIVGRSAAGLAPALEVQGIDAEAVAELPARFEDRAAVVLLDSIPAPRQEALARAVEDGLGLFLTGPAFPPPDQPLHRLLPVFPEPRPPIAGNDERSEDRPGASEGQGEPTGPPAQPEEPPERPPGRPPTGETGEAEPDPGATAEVDRRSVAMVLVVDRSGSMGLPVQGGITKMDYAKRSAYETARALAEGDLVGIITFGTKNAARIELPLTAANDERKLRESIERLSHANEYTYLASALRKAGEMLSAARLAVKHVVVISDGQFNDAPLVLPAIAGQLRERDKTTVSIIQVVAGGPNPLSAQESKNIAQRGGGVLHRTEDPTKIPMLVSLEVTRALDRVGRKPAGADPGVAEPGAPDPDAGEPPPDPPPEQDTPAPETQPDEPESPQPVDRFDIPVRAVSASVLLEPRPETWPSIGGLVPSRGAFDAQVLLVAGSEGRPLLAFANRGLGRVAVWTSDLAGAWGGAWRADPAFPGRFAAWVQSLLPALPIPAAPDLLSATEVDPLRPAPRELATLADWSGRAVRSLGDYEPPAPRRAVSHRGQARELAAWGVAALLLMALVECLAGRFGARRSG